MVIDTINAPHFTTAHRNAHMPPEIGQAGRSFDRRYP